MNSRHVQLCKLAFDQLPTASMVSRWGPTTPSDCPRCHQSAETFAHLLRCGSPKVVLWRSQVMQDLRHLCLTKWNSRYGLVEVLCAGLEGWFQGNPLLDPVNFPPPLHPQQNEMGWDQLFRGRMSVLWSNLQHSHVILNPLRHVTDTGTK
jgi:hypothetical protein